ncbi:MAG: fumarylacetoacetate hydrolase family protein [bacterium]|nr:fumarylacetoacetate hydrolase family protein [bacterium]
MALNVVRYQTAGGPAWGVVLGDRVAPIEGDFPTTRDFMQTGRDAARSVAASTGEGALARADLEVLSPITQERQFLCQAINYYSHMQESGFDPKTSPFNVFFRKASSCLAPATTAIRKPDHVEFLDYEVELGLVFASDVDGPVEVDEQNLHEYVGALVLVNDISARDVQLPEMQFYKGKSYRTFGPCGPFLTLVDADDLARFDDIRLELSVNGETRQNALATDMIHRPAPTLTELSGLQDWQTGDLLATGTPGGCAMQAPPKPIMAIGQIVSPKRRQGMLRRVASGNERRLQIGDVIEARIGTDDGALDLGLQRNEVVPA